VAEAPSEAIAAALQDAVRALDRARGAGEPSAHAAALVRVARLRFRLGQYAAARSLAHEAQTLAAGDAPARVEARQVLGNCAAETGSLAEAESWYRAAADLAREIGYARAQAAALHGLAAGVYLPRGHFSLALAAAEESRGLCARHGPPDWQIYPLIALSMANQITGQSAAAQAALEELRRLAAPGSIAMGYYLCIAAALALDEGEAEAGGELLGQARSIAEASGEPWLNVTVRLGFGRCHRLAGAYAQARTWAGDALAFAERVGYRHEQGRALIERGRAAWLCGDEAAAEADLRAAAELLAELGAAFDLARARLLLAALLHRQVGAGPAGAHREGAQVTAAAARLEAARPVAETVRTEGGAVAAEAARPEGAPFAAEDARPEGAPVAEEAARPEGVALAEEPARPEKVPSVAVAGRLETAPAAAAAAWQAAARSIVDGGYAFLLEQERALAFPLLAAHQTDPDDAPARTSALLLEQLRRVPPPALRAVTLGGWEVWLGKGIVARGALRQRRAGELLALLLVDPGHSLILDQVAEALFPNRPPASAQVLFHHATSALRHALEPDLPDRFPSRYLEVEEGRVTLTQPTGSWIDLESFETACRRGDWEQALALYGGELLPDYRYADWTQAPRERAALLYQRALLAAAEARLAAGCFGPALEACRRLLDLEPWHEEAALLGMRACVALGDRAGARRLYRKLETALRRDLDTAPLPEIQAFYRDLTPGA